MLVTDQVWQIVIAVSLAAGGGLARLLYAKEKMNLGGGRIFAETFISGFAGLMVLLLARSFGFAGDWLGLVCGVAGWIGPRALDMTAKQAAKSIGFDMDPPGESAGESPKGTPWRGGPVSDMPGADMPLPGAFLPDDALPDDPGTDDPGMDEPLPDEPMPDDPLPDDPGTDNPVADEPIPDEPMPDDPVTDESPPDDPMPDEPLPDDPVADDLPNESKNGK